MGRRDVVVFIEALPQISASDWGHHAMLVGGLCDESNALCLWLATGEQTLQWQPRFPSSPRVEKRPLEAAAAMHLLTCNLLWGHRGHHRGGVRVGAELQARDDTYITRHYYSSVGSTVPSRYIGIGFQYYWKTKLAEAGVINSVFLPAFVDRKLSHQMKHAKTTFVMTAFGKNQYLVL
jgi:hypothetical protein